MKTLAIKAAIWAAYFGAVGAITLATKEMPSLTIMIAGAVLVWCGIEMTVPDQGKIASGE